MTENVFEGYTINHMCNFAFLSCIGNSFCNNTDTAEEKSMRYIALLKRDKVDYSKGHRRDISVYNLQKISEVGVVSVIPHAQFWGLQTLELFLFDDTRLQREFALQSC